MMIQIKGMHGQTKKTATITQAANGLGPKANQYFLIFFLSQIDD